METELQEQCQQMRTQLKHLLETSKSVAKVIAPAMIRAHEHFMKDELADALHSYKAALEIAHKFARKGNCGSSTATDDNNEDSEFKPTVLNRRIKFPDIIGMEDIKDILWTEFVLPVKNPSMMATKLKGVMGVLLYGPPGVGKTYLAEAVANEAEVPFFNVILSELDSKWRGESEKLATKLFRSLRKHRYAVVFLDEVESIMANRAEGDSMAKFKSVLLTNIDGIESKNSNSFLLLLAATNCPEMIDKAFSSRFRHQLLARPPTDDQRVLMIVAACKKLYNINLTVDSHKVLKEFTRNYSGRDVAKTLESLNVKPLQKVLSWRHFTLLPNGKYQMCSQGDPKAKVCSAVQLGLCNVEPCALTESDVLDHFRQNFMNKTPQNMRQYEKYARTASGRKAASVGTYKPSGCNNCVASILKCVGG